MVVIALNLTYVRNHSILQGSIELTCSVCKAKPGTLIVLRQFLKEIIDA
jgi:hypothetical protein